VSAIRLLVLGAVRRRGRAHGYQVRADLDSWGANEWSSAKPGSIYHALKLMTAEGKLTALGAAASASGPPRTEYELAEAGEETYFSLLREALRSHDARLDLLSAAVGLIDDLPRGEAISLLRERAEAMDRWRDEVRGGWTDPDDTEHWGPVGEVLGLWLHTAESRAEWTRRLIDRLESGTYVMADER
jgi:DNA-binding PadR family transcriptional regulator